MATNLLTFGPSGIRASASAGHKRPEQNRRRIFSSAAPSSSSPSSSSNWWTPLFGWPSEPDYIDSGSNKADRREDKFEPRPDPELDPRPARSSRFAPGSFTAEKAKQLRIMTQDAGSFHDAMYHSAIASRLASDFGSRPDL
ncbi:uncharacterized protein LOC115756993 [Rhodamnia argentea]|uniref:Uncharacterized protein LOC115756993 n=1 Tax=Rhodamnia argentea TaxID=178133 RepID=A0A8B8R2T2_9MYRT|nr:uncharacterized protein LOC115756993 [Rhodamnia argentea]